MKRILALLLLLPALCVAQYSPPTGGVNALIVTPISTSSTSPTVTPVLAANGTSTIQRIAISGSTGTVTIAAPTGTPGDGQVVQLDITCTNAQTYSWNAAYVGSVTAALQTAATGSAKTDSIAFQYHSSDSKYWQVAYNFGYTP